MYFTYGLFAALAVGMLGCSSASSALDTTTGDTPGLPGPSASIAFTQQGTLTLQPGELATLGITTSPPGPYEVSFYLVGNALDATLDRTTVVAGQDGSTEVTLRAPNRGTTFSVRAVLKDGPSVEAVVAVSDEGFGTLRVRADYAGKRPVEAWVASALAGVTCADLAPTLPADPEGGIVVSGAPDEVLLVPAVPVGPKVAVFVRAGHAMWGCSDAPPLVAGSQTDLTVNIFDKPIELAAASLAFSLGWEPSPEPMAALLAGATTQLLDAMWPQGESESARLLAALVASLPSDALVDASAAVASGGWVDLAAAHWVAASLTLRDSAAAWAEVGMGAATPAITGRVQGLPAAPGKAAVTIDDFLGVSPEDAGIPAEHLLAWSADAEDKVLLSGGLFWLPSRYVGAAMAVAAKVETGEVSVPEALAQEVDCGALAASLGPLPTCDVACVSAACEAGLVSLWSDGLSASAEALSVGTLNLAAGGTATVGDVAEPLGWSGPWVGTLSDGLASAPVGGLSQASVYEPAQ
jgi:hypothetical protein